MVSTLRVKVYIPPVHAFFRSWTSLEVLWVCVGWPFSSIGAAATRVKLSPREIRTSVVFLVVVVSWRRVCVCVCVACRQSFRTSLSIAEYARCVLVPLITIHIIAALGLPSCVTLSLEHISLCPLYSGATCRNTSCRFDECCPNLPRPPVAPSFLWHFDCVEERGAFSLCEIKRRFDHMSKMLAPLLCGAVVSI